VTDWGKIREQLFERCSGRCEVSGWALDFEAFDVHHRRNRGAGGTSRPDVHDLDNLLALNPVIHNGGPQSVHGRRRWSELNGYLVPKHLDHPGMVPVLIHARAWMMLGKDGQYYQPPGR
jgi:hypothetical protein